MKLLSACKVLGALLVGFAMTSAQAAPNAYVVNVLPSCYPPATCAPVTTTAAVTVFNTANNTTVATVPIPATVDVANNNTRGPQEIVLNGALTRGYIANFLDNRVEVLDLNSNMFLTAITLPGGTAGSPIDLAFRPNTDQLYVVRQGGDVVVVDTAAGGGAGAVVGSPIPTGGSGTQAIAFNRSGSRAYVANMNSATVSAIAADASPVPRLVMSPNDSIPTGVQPTDIEYDTVANRLFVTNFGSSNISIFNINPTTDAATPANGSPLALGGQPLGVRLTPDRTRVFVSFPFGPGIASFANIEPFAATLPLVSSATGPRPQYFNFRLSDSRLYVTNGGDLGDSANDTLAVFDIAGATATPVANSPFPVGNNPKYVVIADGQTGPAPAAGTLQFDPAAVTVAENVGSGLATLTVTRTGSAGAVGATVTVTSGSATAPGDFTATANPATVSFADNDNAAKTVTVPITNDGASESDENFTVTLSAPTGGAMLGAATATVTITDDDNAGGGGGTPPPAPAGDGGGGGCTLNAARAADHGLPLLLVIGMFYAFRRRIGR